MASEFVTFLSEVFAQFGVIRAKRMFGGYGIYHHDLMFGLVADDLLYLKADSTTIPDFEKLGLQPFTFSHSGKVLQMSYYQAPEEIFDDFDAAAVWARKAYAVAVSRQAAKPPKPKKPLAPKKTAPLNLRQPPQIKPTTSMRQSAIVFIAQPLASISH